MTAEQIVERALKITGDGGERRKEYGSVPKSSEKIAKGWSVLFGIDITGKQVLQAMVWFKLVRENHKHKDDNNIDMVGYIILLQELQGLSQPKHFFKVGDRVRFTKDTEVREGGSILNVGNMSGEIISINQDVNSWRYNQYEIMADSGSVYFSTDDNLIGETV